MFVTPCCYITHRAEGELEICAGCDHSSANDKKKGRQKTLRLRMIASFLSYGSS